jgi:hypothetical protein
VAFVFPGSLERSGFCGFPPLNQRTIQGWGTRQQLITQLRFSNHEHSFFSFTAPNACHPAGWLLLLSLN